MMNQMQNQMYPPNRNQQQDFQPMVPNTGVRPRFGFQAPIPNPRPRSSASRPNPIASFQDSNCVDYNHGNYNHPSQSYDDSNNMNDSYHSSTDSFGMTQGMGDNSYTTGLNSSQAMRDTSFRSEADSSYTTCFEGSPQTLLPSPRDNSSMAPFKPGNQNGQNFKRGFKRKAPSGVFRCDTCSLDFTSSIPLNMHLTGAKHAKKLKSLQVLKSIHEKDELANDEASGSNPLHCEVCSMTLNSAIQLQMHIDGAKHKNKVQASKKKLEEETNPKTPEGEPPSCTDKSEFNVDEKISEKEFVIPSKLNKYACDICFTTMNSDVQLKQHLDSKKHKAKLEGKSLKKYKEMQANENNGIKLETEESAVDSQEQQKQPLIAFVKPEESPN